MAGQVVLVGCGNIAHIHARAAQMLADRLEYVGVFDVNRARAEAFAEQHGLRPYAGDWQQLLSNPSVEAVDLPAHHVHRGAD